MTNHPKILAEMDAWERRLELCIRPRPKWIPVSAWNWMLKTTLVQVERMR